MFDGPTQPLASRKVAGFVRHVARAERSLTWWQKAQAERGVRGLGYSEIARRIEEDPENVRRWFRGEVSPREGVLVKVADMFGWPVDYLHRPAMPWPPPKNREEWAVAVLQALDANGHKVVAELSDHALSAYLARAVDQFYALRKQLEDMREPVGYEPDGQTS